MELIGKVTGAQILRGGNTIEMEISDGDCETVTITGLDKTVGKAFRSGKTVMISIEADEPAPAVTLDESSEEGDASENPDSGLWPIRNK